MMPRMTLDWTRGFVSVRESGRIVGKTNTITEACEDFGPLRVWHRPTRKQARTSPKFPLP